MTPVSTVSSRVRWKVRATPRKGHLSTAGAASGFKCQMGFLPERGEGVVIVVSRREEHHGPPVLSGGQCPRVQSLSARPGAGQLAVGVLVVMAVVGSESPFTPRG
jgi:hypothetical protein